VLAPFGVCSFIDDDVAAVEVFECSTEVYGASSRGEYE
jgi:hypothetical protein